MGLTLSFVAALLGAQALDLPAPLPPLALDGLPAATRVELERAYNAAAAAPADPAAHGQLAMVLHAHAQYTLAAAWYTRARALDPTSLRWTYLAGVVSAEAGAHADAARAFRAALTIDSSYLPARVRLADMLFRLGDLPASSAEYRTLLEQHPDLAVAHYGLGRVATLRGDREAAIEQYLRATRVSPPFGAQRERSTRALRPRIECPDR